MTEAADLLHQLPKALRPVGTALHKALLKAGCTHYVKTIYIGYELDGAMVAALYPFPDKFELALALPDDHPSTLLIDATHLTWKTLPVAALVQSKDEQNETLQLTAEAFERVQVGVHDVDRPNDYFLKSRRESFGTQRPRLDRPPSN